MLDSFYALSVRYHILYVDNHQNPRGETSRGGLASFGIDSGGETCILAPLTSSGVMVAPIGRDFCLNTRSWELEV
jgi:hypothetical protein